MKANLLLMMLLCACSSAVEQAWTADAEVVGRADVTVDSGSPCVPSCEGMECGDDGCGGECGPCSDGHVCLADGSCLCLPDCSGKECGGDGCGEECGFCPAQHVCLDDGSCLCIAECVGKECGDDGCGGGCGMCNPGYS